MSEMTHIDAGVWISLPKYDWHYAVIMSRHVTHVTCHTCHKCVMRIIRHYLSTLRSLSRYHSLFELVLSSVPWSHIVLFILRWPRPLWRSCSVEAPVTEPTKVSEGGWNYSNRRFIQVRDYTNGCFVSECVATKTREKKIPVMLARWVRRLW